MQLLQRGIRYRAESAAAVLGGVLSAFRSYVLALHFGRASQRCQVRALLVEE